MTKIYVDMDEHWVFWPVVAGSETDYEWRLKKPTMEVSQSLIDEFEVASAAMRIIRDKLEQLYRVQEGLDTWSEPPVPEHSLLEVQPDKGPE